MPLNNPRPGHHQPHAPRHRADVPPRSGASRSRRAMAVVLGVALVASAMPAALAVTGIVAGAARHRAAAAAPPAPNLVVNGGFENDTVGWKVNQARTQLLTTARPAATGAASAQLATTTRSNVVVNDKAPTIESTTAGRTYTVGAFVRATGASLTGKLRVRELRGAAVAQFQTPFEATSGAWTRVELVYTSATSGAKVDLNVIARNVGPGNALLVDDVSMVPGTSLGAPSSSSSSASPTAAASPTATPSPSPSRTRSSAPAGPSSSSTPTSPSSPSSSAPSATSPTSAPGSCVGNAMGIPQAGQAYLGASVAGGTTIQAREKQFGQALGLHRTYYSGAQIDSAVRTATADVAAGRLPWISFKAPQSWTAMASGAGDAWATQLADGLKKVPGPVWLAIHHEPEKDGDLSQWTAMQRRIAPIIHARTNNVAYTVIYSGWNTFGNGTHTLASKWPGDAHVDVTAIDAYSAYGINRGNGVGTKHLDTSSYYVKLSAWAKAHGTAWGIGEMGQSVSAATDDPTWLTRAYRELVAEGGAGLSYFDSNRNSVTDWGLDDPIKRRQYQALLAESARIC